MEDTKATSKFLSYVLRHAPDSIGITLDAQGWVAIDQLLDRCTKHGKALTRALLDEVVANNTKQRFAISDDGQRIRANDCADVHAPSRSAQPGLSSKPSSVSVASRRNAAAPASSAGQPRR